MIVHLVGIFHLSIFHKDSLAIKCIRCHFDILTILRGDICSFVAEVISSRKDIPFFL